MVKALEPDADPLIELDRHTLRRPLPLGQDVGDDAGADGLPPLADRKAQALVHRNRRDQLGRDRHVVPRHPHLPPPPPRPPPPPAPPPRVRLRPIPLGERHMPPHPPLPHLPHTVT